MIEDGRLKMRLGPELARALTRLANDAGMSPEDYVRALIAAGGGPVERISKTRLGLVVEMRKMHPDARPKISNPVERGKHELISGASKTPRDNSP